jgi:thiosulfate reductase cytochrome b subunit
MSDETTRHESDRPAGQILIRRHSAVTRVTHWLNVLCLTILLLSGLQIFNAHPELYWGQYGADGDPAFLTIGSDEDKDGLHGFVRAAGIEVPTTGFLGVSSFEGEPTARAFPGWLTIPFDQDLATGRRWHFFFAWFFVINGAIYLGYGLLSGHFRRDLAPRRRQLSASYIWHEIVTHARLRFPQGEEARNYNLLQKLSYIVVIAGLLPMMLLTGLTMSPGVDAAFPALLDLFGGRQTARTIHFLTASLLLKFVLIHVAMVVLSGAWNNMRSMITGRYAIRDVGPKA